MKRTIQIILTVALTYFICFALVAGTSLLMTAVTSIIAWNDALLQFETVVSIFWVSVVFGFLGGTYAMYSDWDGLMATIPDED